MKTFRTLLPFLGLLIITSCIETTSIGPQGPQGPVGPVGPTGAPGESGFVFEFTNVNFTAPAYDVILSYPTDFQPLASDVALVYLLWEVQVIDGADVEIWRQLPQTVFTDYGTLLYNFDHTPFDVRLFLDANFPLDFLTAIDTDQWIARVVVVPGNFWNSGRLDFSDYNTVKNALGLPDLPTHSAIPRRKL